MSEHTPGSGQLPLFDFSSLDEIWKVVPGYDGRYEASSFGRVRRVLDKAGKGYWRGEIVKPYHASGGYLRLAVTRNGKTRQTGLHQLIAAAFLGACPDGCEVNHKDRDKLNNRPENLEYVTHRENMHHAHRTGEWKIPQGENSAMSKLTNKQVEEIRASSLSQRMLARIYGVSQPTICNLKNRRTYRP